MRRFLVGICSLALGVAGCTVVSGPVPLRTRPNPPYANEVCEMGSIGGVLAPDPTYGLGLRNSGGAVTGVVWPFGYTARREPGDIILLNRLGRIVAREGEHLTLAGGWDDDGVAHPCDVPAPEAR